MDELGNNTQNIRLTYCADPHEISFLDLFIRIENKKLTTKTLRKKTAAKTLLHADSHHPRHLVRSIPVGQFLRIQRSCTTDEDYRREAENLYKRHYSHRSLRRAKRMALTKTRSNIFKPKTVGEDTQDGPVRIITKFGAQWEEVGKIF